MEIPIPEVAYDGPPTPFGGPSLEWGFSHLVSPSEETEDARVSVRNPPKAVIGIISHLRRALSHEFPRNSANVQRKVLAVGLLVIEGLVGKYPKMVESLEQALFQSSKANMRDYLLRGEMVYKVDLGEVHLGQMHIFARNKEHVSRIRNMAEDIGLPVSKVAILCLVAGLAQSLEDSWVPLNWREEFVREIRYFDGWLGRKWK